MPRTMLLIRNGVTVLFLLSLLPFLIDIWMKASAVAAGQVARIAGGLPGFLQRAADEPPMIVVTLWLGGMSSGIWIDETIRARGRSYSRALPFHNKFPNATLHEVVGHVRGYLARVRGSAAPAVTLLAISHAIVDSAVHGTLAMWGRQGERPLELLPPPTVASGTLDIASDTLKVAAPRGRTLWFADVRFDWADVNRIWPPAAPALRPARLVLRDGSDDPPDEARAAP